jgi:type VI secretion system protein ImpG
MSFAQYFHDELTYLRSSGRSFAQAFPALAPMLAEHGGDPEVERLLEGLAYMTARIRQRLDDDFPQIAHGLASTLFPHLARPLASASILELTPLPNVLRERAIVRRGTEFASVPFDGTAFRFTSTFDCELVPWVIDDCRLETGAGGRSQLRVTIRVPSGVAAAQFGAESIRFHAAGDARASLALLASVLQHSAEVSLVEGTATPGSRSVVLARDCLRPVGFGPDEALLPGGENVFPGFRLLTEYHALPANFAFFDVVGLGRLRELDPRLSTFSIVIAFDASPSPEIRVGPDSLKLHCVPIVNVFPTTAEPIRVDLGRSRYLVRPAGLTRGLGEVYSIRSVEAVTSTGDGRLTIPSFYAFDVAGGARGLGRSLAYSTHVQPSAIDDSTDTLLDLVGGDVAHEQSIESLSIELLATNGARASALRPGEITKATPSSPPYATFRNLTPATQHVSTPVGRELQWRAVAHASMNLRSATEIGVLRGLLDVYDLPAIVDKQAARARDLRAAAILGVDVTPAERLYKGVPVRGVDILVRVDERAFRGEGDLFLFGAVLSEFFAGYVSINSFARTSIEGTPSKVRFSWRPRSGTTSLI